MTFDFQILDPLYEISLICERRAQQGQSLFDRNSLPLQRLPDP